VSDDELRNETGNTDVGLLKESGVVVVSLLEGAVLHNFPKHLLKLVVFWGDWECR